MHPFYLETSLKRRGALRRRRKKLFVVGAAAAFALFLFLAFSPFFSIQKMRFKGNEAIGEEALGEFSEEYLSGRSAVLFSAGNAFFFRKDAFIEALQERFPRISRAEVRLDLLHRGAEVTIVERKPSLIWCVVSAKECSYADETGVVYERAPDTSGSLLLRVEDEENDSFALGSVVAERADFARLLGFKTEMSGRLGVGITKLSLRGDGIYMHVVDGWYLIAAEDADPAQLALILKSLFEKEIPSELQDTLEYVDARIPERLYYRFREG